MIVAKKKEIDNNNLELQGGDKLPRKSRKLIGEILCHHMVQGINREYIFQAKEDKEKYLQLLQKFYKEFNIKVIAYCIMDNHVHMVLYSTNIENISKFMHYINSIYAKYYNKKNDRVGYVFRNRFDSIPIMTMEQLYKCIKYIHMNPVKAGIVSKEEDYFFSSYNDYLNKTGFVQQNILDFIFYSSNNYIQDFKSIEYIDLNTHKKTTDLNGILEKFLIKEGSKLQQIRRNKEEVLKFISYLNKLECKFSKKEICDALKIGRTTLYRWTKE